MKACESHASLPSLVQRFFTDWLIAQRQASPHTVASYRDTFRLLLAYPKFNRVFRSSLFINVLEGKDSA